MTSDQVLIVVLCGVVTLSSRASFLLFADRMGELSPRVRIVLRMIPPSALAALTIPAILRPGDGAFDVVSPIVLGALAAAGMSLWRRDLFSPLAVGLLVIVVAEQLLA